LAVRRLAAQITSSDAVATQCLIAAQAHRISVGEAAGPT
jgi:hypothetical protein